ncbi:MULTISPECIES: NRDE family protein [unclassified Spirosoma]|uniref:NRDE family protein n=1 Tax=unclassified Spirosoma TaxID=2621999 RepID=UPI00096433D5|nr:MULTISPECIES: NRDE family protein [unclassified Spirosoma]MBN8826881.1 NRDE family protein [Spirosoma sp.]OJW75558.1 MAG: hypothetical protein BGO59_08460 [Spirosoma sp. 48-14]
MCTATFLPHPAEGFILTHSRDEKTARPAAEPALPHDRNGQELVYPEDPLGGGTWIVSSVNTTVCLLNGGYKAHNPQPPYRHSRGLVPLQVFDYETIDDFLEYYNPSGLEPFTLLLARPDRLVEVRWTGNRLFIHEKDPNRAHIWSSVTLYTPDVIETRDHWFRDWLSHNPSATTEAIRFFHLHAGESDEANALRMNRNNKLMTLSLTTVAHTNGQVAMQYDDLIRQQSSFHLLHSCEHATA